MTPGVFKKSRKLMKLSQTALGDRIGLSCRMIQYIEKGESPITKTVECALRWVAYNEFMIILPVEYQEDLIEKKP